MPYPIWLAKVSKRVFNPREVKRGERPVVIHVGRSSGSVYETPLDGHPTDGGFVLAVRYGPDSDWVKNILASKRASLRVGGEEVPLRSPRLVNLDQAIDEFEPGSGPAQDLFKAGHYLLLARSG